MHKRFKVLFIIIAIFLIIFMALSILFGLYAPKIVEDQIWQNLKVKASLRKISLSLPFTVTLEKLEIGDLASIKKISLSPNLVALLFGKIVIHSLNIVEPVINLELSKDGKLNLPVLEEKGSSPAIYITSLNLRDGKIIFTDKLVAVDGFKVIVNKLNIKVAKVALPISSLATNFNLSAQLLSSGGKPFGDIAFGGWLDYLAKDMDAELEIKGLDVTEFSVYFGNFISNRKLSSAQLDLISTFKAKHNVLGIATKLNLSKLVYAQGQEQAQSLDLNLMKNALDLFTDPKGNLSLEFDIDTLLNKPALSPEKIRKIILKAALKNLTNQSPQQLVDKVATVIDQYKGLGKELKAIFSQ